MRSADTAAQAILLRLRVSPVIRNGKMSRVVRAFWLHRPVSEGISKFRSKEGHGSQPMRQIKNNHMWSNAVSVFTYPCVRRCFEFVFHKFRPIDNAIQFASIDGIKILSYRTEGGSALDCPIEVVCHHRRLTVPFASGFSLICSHPQFKKLPKNIEVFGNFMKVLIDQSACSPLRPKVDILRGFCLVENSASGNDGSYQRENSAQHGSKHQKPFAEAGSRIGVTTAAPRFNRGARPYKACDKGADGRQHDRNPSVLPVERHKFSPPTNTLPHCSGCAVAA